VLFVRVANSPINDNRYNISREKADNDHPYGHGKFESLGTVFVGGVLIATSLGVGFYSVDSLATVMLSSPSLVEASSVTSTDILDPRIALSVAALSIFSKEVMYQKTHDVGVQTNSSVLKANAYHHRADAISSIFSFAGIGAGLFFANPYFDPLGGVLVSSLIFKSGAEIFFSPIQELLDTVRDKNDPLVISVKHLISSKFENDITVETIKIRNSGPFVLIDVVVNLINSKLSASSAHQIGELVKQEIIESLNSESSITPDSIMVHINPPTRAELNDSLTKGETLLPSPAHYEAAFHSLLSQHGVTLSSVAINYTSDNKMEVELAITDFEKTTEAKQLLNNNFEEILGVTVNVAQK